MKVALGQFTTFHLINCATLIQHMKTDKSTFLLGLKSLLSYHLATGIDNYPKSSHSESFFRIQPLAPPLSKPETQVEKVHQKQVAAGQNRNSGEKSSVSIKDITEEVAVCHACTLREQRIYPVAGQGPERVRLLLIGDWLSGDASGKLPPGQLFGVEQDVMLTRMLAAIQLPIDSVFITNVIKCAVPSSCQPQAQHVQTCVSFLRRQILVLMPEIICTMGMVAARATLEKSLPLSRLRGRVHEYVANKDITIPVVSTYHPTYLLQNPEMKAATWADLQLLARELQRKTA